MSVGISVYNDKNTLQLDDRCVTYGLIQKYTTRDLSDLYDKVCAYAPTVSGGKIQINPPSNYQQPNDVDVFLFGQPNNTANVGLQIFKEDSSVAFHSANKPIRVVDFIRTSVYDNNKQAMVLINKTYTGYGRLGVIVGNSTAMIFVPSNLNIPVQLIQPQITITGNTIEFYGYGRTLNPSIRENLITIPGGYNDYIVVDLTDY